MNRIIEVGLSFCVAGSLTACVARDVTGPATAAVESFPQAAALEPASGELHLNGPRPVEGYLEGNDQYGDACGGGAGIIVTSTGTGTIAHFGMSVMVSTTCLNLSDFGAIGPVPFSIRAANGDEAGGYVTGFAFTAYGFDIYTSVTWGTGRFQDATGELTFPTHTTGPGIWWSGVEGWITY